MSLYNCVACSESISATKARIQCQNCTSYDLCASCFVVGKTSLAHQISHDTVLFTNSGHNFATISKLKQPSAPIANPLIRRRPLIAPPTLPPRPTSSIYTSGTSSASQSVRPIPQQAASQSSIYQLGQQYQQAPPPPPSVTHSQTPSYQTDATTQYVPKSPDHQAVPNTVSTPKLPENPYANPPDSANVITHPSAQPLLRTPPLAENPYANPPQVSSSGGNVYPPRSPQISGATRQWQALQSSGNPTPFCRSMLSAVFERVDAQRTGLLSPEQYSAFLDVQQYRVEENACM